MLSKDATGYANVKRRVIYRNPKTGAFYIKTAAGMRKYSPTARFRMTNNGKAVRITMNTRNKVPMKLRPARARISAADAKKKAAQRLANKRANYGVMRILANARPSIRKIRSDFGKLRNLIASPGGTTYKGKSAMTRAHKKRMGPGKPKTLMNIRANLMNKGFNPKAAVKVAPMIKRGMSPSRYSKTTGRVKKN
jgi:hypothetical protein